MKNNLIFKILISIWLHYQVLQMSLQLYFILQIRLKYDYIAKFTVDKKIIFEDYFVICLIFEYFMTWYKFIECLLCRPIILGKNIKKFFLV